MSEQFKRFIPGIDDDDTDDVLAICEMGEHEYELTIHLLDGIIPMAVEVCIHCGAISWEN